ncbi:MAG: hypothetical protein ACR2M0_12700 [Chloroflexia bacterium]
MTDTAKQILDRILRESGMPALLEFLGERLARTDLQSLMLAVYGRRAVRQTPSRVLDQYAQNRFVGPATVSLRAIAAVDSLALAHADPLFEALDLAPVCPLGTVAALTGLDQNRIVSTARNTEVVSDSTNVLALECALRRRAARRQTPRDDGWVRLCTSHRLLRAQYYGQTTWRSHFRLFALCTAGRDSPAARFECAALAEHLGFYLALMAALPTLGYELRDIRIVVTDLGADRAALEQEVFGPLAARLAGVEFEFDPEQTSGRGYYDWLRFHLYATDAAGVAHEIGDGGFTDWTQQLLSDRRERLLISGISTERICELFGAR